MWYGNSGIGFGSMMGAMGVMGFVMILFFGILIFAVVFGVRMFTRTERGYSGGNSSHDSGSALHIVKERYARGEISRDEYDRLRDELKD
ncbi:SHOCT domain-containing protein [Ferroacidibacillus organovorans]|nr:SHOCT domain-containing protein [Ferroacidibacillus organovorans]